MIQGHDLWPAASRQRDDRWILVLQTDKKGKKQFDMESRVLLEKIIHKIIKVKLSEKCWEHF